MLQQVRWNRMFDYQSDWHCTKTYLWTRTVIT